MFNVKKIFLLIIILIFSIAAVHGQTVKKLTIRGLRIFTEDEIYSQLNLNRFDEGKIDIAQVISEIENFYKEKGYILVKVYSTDVESDEDYEIFIDEGRLEKIIIHNLGVLNMVRFKREIDIPARIYNTEVINQNLKKLQKEFPQFDISINVLKTPDYESGIIQLDREFRRIRLLRHFDTLFLARYRGYNDLHFFVANKNVNAGSSQQYGNRGSDARIGIRFNYNFPSAVIPQISFSKDHVFFEKDYFKSVFSVGYNFDFKKLINKSPSFFEFMPHEMSFAELRYEYKVGLIDSDFFGPLVNGKLYWSHSSRGDLGIIRYDYSYSKTVLAPEFTLLKDFNIYAGLGFEALVIANSIIDQRVRYLDVKDEVVYSEFAEVRLQFDPIKIEIGNKIDRYIVLTYDRYFRRSRFEQLELIAIYETEFRNRSVLSFGLKGFKLFGEPQFYRSEEVNDKYFLGFTGKEYYTNSKIAFSSEYRFSIYREFLYLGGFFDTTVFKPEGYIISGTKFGIGYGPSLRILVYDQYQFIVYYGYDVLYPDKQKGVNLNMRFSRKW